MSGRQKIEEEYKKSKEAIAQLALKEIERIKQGAAQVKSEAEKIGAEVEKKLKEASVTKKKS